MLLTLLVGTSVLAQETPDKEGVGPGGAGAVANWLHFGYDNSYTAYNPLERTIGVTNVARLERKWGIGCGDAYFSVIFRSLAIYEEVLYTSGAGTRLTAYEARTGRQLWQYGNGNAGWAPQPTVSEDGNL